MQFNNMRLSGLYCMLFLQCSVYFYALLWCCPLFHKS